MDKTLVSKLNSMRSKISDHGYPAYDKYSQSNGTLVRYLEKLPEALETAINAPRNEKFSRRIASVKVALSSLLDYDLLLRRPDAVADPARAWLYFAKKMTQLYAIQHISVASQYRNPPDTGRELAHFLLGLSAIGWTKEAQSYCTFILTEQRDQIESNTIMPNELFAWFSLYFTLGSRDLIANTKLKEPNKPDSIYSKLLGDWQDSDTSILKETLDAYAELNVGNTLLPESKRPLDISNPELLHIPYDVLAINMRRHAMDLHWVEIDDPRMEGWPVSTNKRPLVKDNVVWPAYLKLCEMIEIVPFQSELEIEVTLDPETLEIIS